MRILIVNPFGIGDVLFSTPLISNLRQAFPASYIGYICNIRAKDVLYSNPQINEIFIFEKDEYRNLWKKSRFKCISRFISFLLQIKEKKFDVLIDLSLGCQYNFFLWFIGVRKRIGYNYRNRGRFLTHKVDIDGYNSKPVVEYYLDLLKFFGIQPKAFGLRMNIPEADENWADIFFKRNNLQKNNLIVGIIPAGGASWGKDFSYRHWPWENYALLANRLVAELKAKIIILGDASEQDICQKVKNITKGNSIDACGTTTLTQFAALAAKCSLIVCNDGGPLHVAVSQGVTTVSIFGPVDEKVYGPYPPGQKHVVITKNIDCRPCYRNFKLPSCTRNRQCINEILTEDVFNAIKNLVPKINM